MQTFLINLIIGQLTQGYILATGIKDCWAEQEYIQKDKGARQGLDLSHYI